MNSLPSNTSSISKGIFFLPVPYKRPVAFGSGLIEYIFLHESSFFKFIIVIQNFKLTRFLNSSLNLKKQGSTIKLILFKNLAKF